MSTKNFISFLESKLLYKATIILIYYFNILFYYNLKLLQIRSITLKIFFYYNIKNYFLYFILYINYFVIKFEYYL